MAKQSWTDVPLDQVRRYLEPGPIVMITSSHRGETGVMTLGWHMMLGFEPALVATYIWEGNHSYDLIRKSRECVINLPTADMLDIAIRVGNSSGSDGLDKFEAYALTPFTSTSVEAPSIEECHAHFECKLFDSRLVKSRGLFIWEVTAARARTRPARPQTAHYRGNGEFMLAGKHVSRRSRFLPQNL